MRASVIPHPPGERLVVIRESYMRLCDGEACQAAILSVAEYWTNVMMRRLEDDEAGEHESRGLWFYKTLDDWHADLLGMFSVNTIDKHLKVLIARGFLESRRNPRVRFDRTLQYRLHWTALGEAVTQNGDIDSPNLGHRELSSGSAIPERVPGIEVQASITDTREESFVDERLSDSERLLRAASELVVDEEKATEVAKRRKQYFVVGAKVRTAEQQELFSLLGENEAAMALAVSLTKLVGAEPGYLVRTLRRRPQLADILASMSKDEAAELARRAKAEAKKHTDGWGQYAHAQFVSMALEGKTPGAKPLSRAQRRDQMESLVREAGSYARALEVLAPYRGDWWHDLGTPEEYARGLYPDDPGPAEPAG